MPKLEIKFKEQDYQTKAVEAVADAFYGQPFVAGNQYIIDPGIRNTQVVDNANTPELFAVDENQSGWANEPIHLPDADILKNLQSVWSERVNIKPGQTLQDSPAGPNVPNLSVEMETGTGKTYVYIKTIMELHQRYGWGKFIIVVPSVAIREGVFKSFKQTKEHFFQSYETRPDFFVYDSSNLHKIEEFSANSGVQVMIINIQAFNKELRNEDKETDADAKKSKTLRMFRELDQFGSRRPIDVIRANRPIVIIDEPQKMHAKKSQEAISKFEPLMVLRYSATHKDPYTLVHRLDALDAYNAKLVKKISVRGIKAEGATGSRAYFYVQSVVPGAKGKDVTARVELETLTASGKAVRKTYVLKKSDDLQVKTKNDAYQGIKVADIDAWQGTVELTNHDDIHVGELVGAIDEAAKRRIQIKEVIEAHLLKERKNYKRGIKTLSLFFIDEVAKYRDYSVEDTRGEYAIAFEELYSEAVADIIDSSLQLDPDYVEYLKKNRDAAQVHAGYFSIDKKSGHFEDSKVSRSGEDKGESNDTDAYDLILRNKERLLSLEEPVRFIFSHSALREGWDNPNVFTLGMLKKSDSGDSRRQEVGRGLRISVNQNGERQDDEQQVHDINVLTVVTDESYTDFVDGLQQETREVLKDRPKEATTAFFEGRTYLSTEGVTEEISHDQAELFVAHLKGYGYIDSNSRVTQAYLDAKIKDELEKQSAFPALSKCIDFMWPMFDALIEGKVPVDNDRNLQPLRLKKDNFGKLEFKTLWDRINRKAIYHVDFESDELISNCISVLDSKLNVTKQRYTVETGTQRDTISDTDLAMGNSFVAGSTKLDRSKHGRIRSTVKYDLIGKIAANTHLTRRTVTTILSKIRPTTFAYYKDNPTEFIALASKLINSQKSKTVVEHISYDLLAETFDNSIFTVDRNYDFSHQQPLEKHIYDYLVTDSKVERDFAAELEKNDVVSVYAKLPNGFYIPTPMGKYNPDWAIAFQEGSVKHVYFVAETKGSTDQNDLRNTENGKIESARKFFEAINEEFGATIMYHPVATYAEMLNKVS